MKKLALVMVLGFSAMACRAQVKIQTTAQAPVAEPAPPPPPAPAPAPEPNQQITLPDQIEFEFDEARIKQTPKTLAALEQLADVMKQNPQITKLRVEGHTDNVGRAKHNDKLSKARAEAVAKWLAQHDVDPSRVVTFGYGASRPLASNDTADGRAQNRRTEYYVHELEGKTLEGAPATPVAVRRVASAGGGKSKLSH
ncbi:MAG: OmpA family protein [Labilithrix sp.]|nr:OmpA family protein [Labilithrix sp.]